MISGLIMTPRLESNIGPVRVTYTLDPYDKVAGPLRAMQKFTVILMTGVGTDPIRPWFGTKLSKLVRMNVVDTTETKVFVRDQVSEAIRQFFKLQSLESSQNTQTADDIITSIELISLDINAANQISITVRFTPAKAASIVYSMKVN